jgi:ABC-type nitrate/sulfonate/bicarbonate transport system permease component
LPLFGFIPLFIYWFSSRPMAVVGYVAFATILVVLPGAAAATARGASPVYVNLARCAGANSLAIFRYVVIPSTWPLLKPTLRFAVALMWAFSLGAEYAGSPRFGVGVLVYQAYLWSDMGRMLVAAGVYLFAGIVSLWLFDLLVGRLIAGPRNSIV